LGIHYFSLIKWTIPGVAPDTPISASASTSNKPFVLNVRVRDIGGNSMIDDSVEHFSKEALIMGLTQGL